MIEARELRIGNNLSYGIVEKIVVTVETIGNDGINHKEIFDEDYPGGDPFIDFYKYQDLEPIPLTPEILGILGFKNAGNWWHIKTLGLSPQTINISLIHNETTFGNNEEYPIKNIEYLHQLQNVLFDLAGEELTLSLHSPTPDKQW